MEYGTSLGQPDEFEIWSMAIRGTFVIEKCDKKFIFILSVFVILLLPIAIVDNIYISKEP